MKRIRRIKKNLIKMITVEHFVKFACEFITFGSVGRQRYSAEGKKKHTTHIGIKNATAEFPARKPFFPYGHPYVLS